LIEIGTVQSIHRYPVKSMRGEDMPAVQLRWTGFDGDRQYAFYRAGDKTRFPWLTGREVPDLVRHVPLYVDPANPRGSAVRVRTPDGAELDVTSEELRLRLSDAAGEEVRLLQVGRGTFDSMPVSVITTTTGATLDRSFGSPLGLGRFRANVIVAPHPGSAASETDWFNGALVFGDGSTRLRVNRPIERCAFITIDPQTAAKDVSVLRMVAQQFNNEVGAYCTTEAVGPIAVGDRVRFARD
jgi:uncharacterized protein YcbX